PAYDRFGAAYSFNPATGALVVPDDGLKLIHPLFPKNIPITTASQAGFPARSLLDLDLNNFYPRFGFAYRPFANDKTVIRGGFGMYGSTEPLAGFSGGPFAGDETFTNAIVNGAPLFSFPNPFLTAGTTATQNVSGINPAVRAPYSQQWNLTIERELRQIGIR